MIKILVKSIINRLGYELKRKKIKNQSLDYQGAETQSDSVIGTVEDNTVDLHNKSFDIGQQNWVVYQMQDVVDVNDAKMSVRNYIEQKDLRTYLGLINNKRKINTAAEFGCGYGRMSQVLAEFAPKVVALEREQSFVNEAAALISDITFIQVNDLSEKKLESHAFDVIITFTVLQHLIDDQAQKVVREMVRCLKTNGHILICEETDKTHIAGAVNDPLGRCTIGRTVEKYCQYFKPLVLEFTAPRRIEPGYPRENIGTYMIFRK